MSEHSEDTTRRGWGRRGRLTTGLNVTVSILAAVLAVIMINYISARYLWYRTDAGASRFYELSDKTKSLLSSIKGEITAHVVFRATTVEQQETLSEVMNLLKEYKCFADKLDSLLFRVERIDPDRDLGRAEALKVKYGLRDGNTVVFDVGGRSRSVPERQMVESEYSAAVTGVKAKKVAFRGEEAFSSAILGITEEKKPVVYFTRGHKERDVDDFAKDSGYAEVARRMRLDNIDVRFLCMTEYDGIPADCDLLVVAGPRTPFHQSEVSAMNAYANANRNLMLLLDAGQTSGLEALCEQWGVGLPRGKVTERTVRLRIDADGGATRLAGTGEEVYIHRFGPHAVTARLENSSLVLYLPRAVVPIASTQVSKDARSDQHRVVALASSSENSWLETDFQQDPPQFDPATDRQGPIPVAVAVEKGLSSGASSVLKPTRFVVIGDSDFAANGKLSGGNEDFFMSSINWLLERGTLMTIGPKMYGKSRLVMDEKQVTHAFAAIVVAIPVVVMVIGFMVWLRRAR